MKKKVYILDTSLRDGEQAPGCQLISSEKLKIAYALEKLNVDIIEAGFPISSPDDFKSVANIAKNVKKSTICALARAKKEDIDCAYKSIQHAKKKRIHIFLSTSDIHIKHQLNSTRAKVLKQIQSSVSYAKKLTSDIEFSPMDATRSEREFLIKAVNIATTSGATVINIPDTTGYTHPFEFKNLIKFIYKNFSKNSQYILSVHCHNDLGLATANAFAGILAGARQVECTINGIGERAGNTALEEIVMLLKTREASLGYTTNIKTPYIYQTSKLVSRTMHMPIQPNKAIVGRNAFAHSAGIHQHGILKYRNTYEIINPNHIGVPKSKIVLTARSGRSALKYKANSLGYKLTPSQLNKLYNKFLELADTRKKITDNMLLKLIQSTI